MVLLPVPASPIVCQLSSMVQSALRTRKNPGFAASIRLRDHAAEELPLRVVAAAAEAAGAGQPVAAVHRHRLSDRGVAAGGERVCGPARPRPAPRVQAGDEPLVRGEQAIDPAGRAAAARDGRDDFGEDVEAVFEPAIGLRPHDAEEVQLPHARDHVVADAPRRLRSVAPARAQARRSRAPARGDRERRVWRPAIERQRLTSRAMVARMERP